LISGPITYAIWIVGLLLNGLFVVCAFYRREFLRYLPLNLYMLLCGVANFGLYVCNRDFGVHSREYFYSYYSSDILLSLLMYCVIAELFGRVFEATSVCRYIRGAAVILLGFTALFAYISALHATDHLTTQFVVELEQDLNFVGVVLIYVLWGAVIKLRESRVRLVQVILALGVYFSAIAGAYALRNLFPTLEFTFLRWLPPVSGLWLLLAWTYTFVRVPDDARLAPGHTLVTSH
jgi:hypothetical protein